MNLVELYHFNPYWSFIITFSFAYSFAEKTFAKHVSNYFWHSSWYEKKDRYYKQVADLSNIKEQFASLQAPSVTRQYRKDYNDFHDNLNILWSDHENNFNYFENIKTDRFVTLNFKMLCYLAGLLCLAIIVSGGFILTYKDKDVVYESIRAGIYVWVFFIVCVFIIDLFQIKLKGNILHFRYFVSIIVTIIVLVVIHLRSYYIYQHMPNFYFASHNSTIIYLVITSILHIVLYFIFGLLYVINWYRQFERKLRKLRSKIDILEIKLNEFLSHEKWAIEDIQQVDFQDHVKP